MRTPYDRDREAFVKRVEPDYFDDRPEYHYFHAVENRVEEILGRMRAFHQTAPVSLMGLARPRMAYTQASVKPRRAFTMQIIDVAPNGAIGSHLGTFKASAGCHVLLLPASQHEFLSLRASDRQIKDRMLQDLAVETWLRNAGAIKVSRPGRLVQEIAREYKFDFFTI